MYIFKKRTCGNVAVLTTIYHVVRSSRATLDNTLIYVIVLSCVDFGVCLSLPFTVIDQAPQSQNDWESLGKFAITEASSFSNSLIFICSLLPSADSLLLGAYR
ncbi:hypothetical protein TELCIR_01462 [Teladorsagia circumcincta]|uniref:Uncharacterized protein n=1 Tax=Teladorsagia circumcincta TaxID=45464 RepID=A0A2G9V256_TELCI|nr:hypothetical protein TELCIR_01462 [Teladorsagia circumcincta]